MDPLMEITSMKTVELFAESIPGCIIQLAAIATGKGGVRLDAMGSIMVSAMTAGYTSATISYDFDADPNRRELSPNFHGYIPDSTTSRALVLFCLVGIMLLIKSTMIVLLW